MVEQLICEYGKKKLRRRKLKNRILETYESISLLIAHFTALAVLIPTTLPLILQFRLEQRPGILPPLTWLLPGHSVSLGFTRRLPRVLPPGQQLFLWGPSARCASQHCDFLSLYYNALFMHLYPTCPEWEFCQAGEHVLFMAKSAGLGHCCHTVNLLNKSTNNWIHIPLPWVTFKGGNQRTNNTHWLHWFLKLLHPRLKDGPCLPHLFRTMYISPCSHDFIHVFAKGKCSSWVGHLVMGLPAEQGRWHQALHALYPVGGQLLCLLVTSSLTHNLIFSKCKVPTATLKDILSDIQFNN